MRQVAPASSLSFPSAPATGPEVTAAPSGPAANITYQYFTLLAHKMAGQPQQAHQMPDNMVQAVCDYLAWKTNRPVALSAVALFLRQEWWQVLARLREYTAVMPLVARTQHLANVDSLFYGDKPGQVFRAASERVTACLAFEQQQLADAASELPVVSAGQQAATRGRVAGSRCISPEAPLTEREQAVTRREQALELNAALYRLAVAIAFLLGGLAGAGLLLYVGGELMPGK